jgi:uncharacterized protein YnzC (UPF0291/DUF896 family)
MPVAIKTEVTLMKRETPEEKFLKSKEIQELAQRLKSSSLTQKEILEELLLVRDYVVLGELEWRIKHRLLSLLEMLKPVVRTYTKAKRMSYLDLEAFLIVELRELVKRNQNQAAIIKQQTRKMNEIRQMNLFIEGVRHETSQRLESKRRAAKVE